MRLLCTLCIGVSRKLHLHFTFLFSLRYYKMVQNWYKNWLQVSKTTWGIWETLYKQWKVHKVEFDGLLLPKNCICPKNTFLQLRHYIQRIYLTLLPITCVKNHQITYVIFETISHFLQYKSSVFFSSNITYFLQKYPII